MVNAAPNATFVTARVARIGSAAVPGQSSLVLRIRASAPIEGMTNVLAPGEGDELEVMTDPADLPAGVDVTGWTLAGVITMVGPGVIRLQPVPAPVLTPP